MTAQETFITRLRRHRERNRISLEEIVNKTRIRRDQLEAFERGDLETWPRGIYARAWIRAYADVIGLDPIDTVDEFCRLFPQGDRRAEGTFRDFAAIVAHQSTYHDEFAGGPDGDRRRPTASHLTVVRRPMTWRDYVVRFARRVLSIRGARGARSPRPVRTIHTN
jgi:transcriptional regulator with XRE-family HTH domain